MKSKTLNMAVIGAGAWAQLYHLPAIKLLQKKYALHITGIWNRSPEKAIVASEKFGIQKVYRRLDELISDADIHCLAIIVRADALVGILDTVRPKKLPVLTEKPPGRNYAEAKQLSAKIVVPNVVAFNRRYTPLNRKFKQIADDMAGVYYAECQFYRNQRHYPDFITETGIHGINYMEYLCGRIGAVRTEKWKNPENETFIWISRIVFESGVKGLIKFFPCSGASIERYELHSSKSSAHLYSPQHYTEDCPGRITVRREGKIQQVIEGDADEDPLVAAGFLDEYVDFFEAVRNGKQTVSNFQNAHQTMKIAEAIEKGVDLQLGFE